MGCNASIRYYEASIRSNPWHASNAWRRPRGLFQVTKYNAGFRSQLKQWRSLRSRGRWNVSALDAISDHQFHMPAPSTDVMVAPGGSGYVSTEHPVAKALNRARNLHGFHQTSKTGRTSSGQSLQEASSLMHAQYGPPMRSIGGEGA